MKKLFLTALLLILGLQALPAHAAEVQPFVRWAVYAAEAQNTPALFKAVTAYNAALQQSEGVLAVYGGEDESGVMRYLEIYKDEAACTALQNSAKIKSARAEIKQLAAKTGILNAEAFFLQSKISGTADKPRMARLVIDPAQLDDYKKVLAKEMRASVTNEPGVLALLATTEAENPQRLSPAGAVRRRRCLPGAHRWPVLSGIQQRRAKHGNGQKPHRQQAAGYRSQRCQILISR